MPEKFFMQVIAHIRSDFSSKFGIPRQSGLVDELKAKIVFEPEYRNPDAFRGIEGYSHLWLVWQFSQAVRSEWSPTVRPPRLGGNTRMGVFATRSPYRPNAIGLSSVKLDKMEMDSELGPVLYVSGADLLDNSPIYDIKPYLTYTDSHPDARCGFAFQSKDDVLKVDIPEELLKNANQEKVKALRAILAQDPRPAYQEESDRIYSFEFADMKIRFSVDKNVLTVCEIINEKI